MYKIFLTLIFSCIISLLFSQNKIDSLQSLIQSAEGNEKVDLLNEFSWNLKYSDPKQALLWNREGIQLSKKINYTKGEAQAIYQSAALYYLKGEVNQSLELCEIAGTLFKSIDNSLGTAKNQMMIGMNMHRLKNYPQALKHYEKALAICKLFDYEELMTKVQSNQANVLSVKGDFQKALEAYSSLSDTWLSKGDSTNYYISLFNVALTQRRLGAYPEALTNYYKLEAFEKSINRPLYLANIYNEIGVIYLRLGLKQPTLDMFEKAIQLYEELENSRKIAMVNINLGIYFFDNKVYEKSEFHYNKVLQIYDSLELKTTGSTYNNLAALKIETKNYKEALILLDTSLKINLANGDKGTITKNYTNMGAANFEIGELQKSELFYKKALMIAEETCEIAEQQKAAEGLAKIFKKKGNQKAFQIFSNKAKVASDSLFNKEKLMELNRLLVTKQHEEYEHKIKTLTNDLSTVKKELAINKKSNVSFFSQYKIPLILFSSILIGGIFYFLKKQKRINSLNSSLQNKVAEEQQKFELELENKNKELALISLENAQQSNVFKKIKDSLQQIVVKNPNNPEVKKLEQILLNYSSEKNTWENFTFYFNQVYIGFFDRLSESYPSFSNKELQLCALIRLRIPIYEVSVILGISPKSVHMARYRIRKKMGLDAEKNIDDYICSI